MFRFSNSAAWRLTGPNAKHPSHKHLQCSTARAGAGAILVKDWLKWVCVGGLFSSLGSLD
jgi:hypothetical protein